MPGNRQNWECFQPNQQFTEWCWEMSISFSLVTSLVSNISLSEDLLSLGLQTEPTATIPLKPLCSISVKEQAMQSTSSDPRSEGRKSEHLRLRRSPVWPEGSRPAGSSRLSWLQTHPRKKCQSLVSHTAKVCKRERIVMEQNTGGEKVTLEVCSSLKSWPHNSLMLFPARSEVSASSPWILLWRLDQ